MSDFKFFQYQHDDIPRAAMHDGAIIAWDPGLGKTLAMLTWSILKKSRRTLIVAPASLHTQIIDEATRFFGIEVTILKSQDCYYTHRLWQPAPPTTGPLDLGQYFITDYHWLGRNGADEWEDDTTNEILRTRRNDIIHRLTGSFPTDTTYHTGIGSEHYGIRCVMTPSLSTLISHHFHAVACDEAVRLKSGTAFIAQGVLRLSPQYRLLLSGTPIKNRLTDFFWLGWWIAGGNMQAHVRFPYSGEPHSIHDFAKAHLVMEENLTKAAASAEKGDFKSFKKRTNRLCNIHRLWKFLGPLIIRRRKDEVGSDIVKKNIIPIAIPPGTLQQACYQHHIQHPPICKTPLAAIGAQIQNLRQVALHPSSEKVFRNLRTSIWTPKVAAILQLAADLMQQGEQLVVFSPFQDFSAALSNLLLRHGISNICLDGNTSPTKRGLLAKEFKSGKYPILIAGLQSMGEGHSFDNARNLILPSLDWAYDANTQAIDRVHRLTSKKDVTIYIMVTQNSIDQKLAAIFQEKGDASDLALDGRLYEDDREEINVAQLLKDTVAHFDPKAETISEESIRENATLTLIPRLQKAYTTYLTIHPSTTSTPTTQPENTKPCKQSLTKPKYTKAQLSFLSMLTEPEATTTTEPENIIPFPAPTTEDDSTLQTILNIFG